MIFGFDKVATKLGEVATKPRLQRSLPTKVDKCVAKLDTFEMGFDKVARKLDDAASKLDEIAAQFGAVAQSHELVMELDKVATSSLPKLTKLL